MWLRKLGIIVYKNLLLRKRQYIITSLELLLPVITALILAFMARSTYKDDNYSKPETILEKELLSKCESWCKFSNSSNVTDSNFIAYLPETTETTRVVQQVVDEICGNANGTIGLLPVANASELEDKCNVAGNCRAALVFPDKLQALQTNPTDKAASINYEIRMKKFTKSRLLPEQTPTNEDFIKLGPNPEHRKYSLKYFHDGFLGLQIATEKVLAKTLTGETNWNNTISLRSFPTPPFLSYSHGSKQDKLQKFIIAFAFFMLLMIPTIVWNVVGEKQSGMTELLRVAGVSNGIQSIGWLIHATAPHLITVSLVTILFCEIKLQDGTALLAYGDGSVLWVFLFLSVVYAAAFLYFICSLFQRPKVAMIVAIIIWLIVGLFTFFQMATGGILYGKAELLICIFPTAAYIHAMRIIYQFDTDFVDDSEQPLGAQWSRIQEDCPWKYSTESATLLDIMIMQLFFTVLYIVLATYFECKLPSKYGEKRPWNICSFKKTKSGNSFWLFRNMTRVAIDVQNVTKRFGDKVAVNGVSLQVNSNHIFAILGNSGAGKSTLISVITGWSSPTSGNILVNDMHSEDHLNREGEKMTLCPQQNVLFESLSVSENLRIFGMLGGLRMKESKLQIKELLISMILTAKANTCARKLTGEEKRKVCLGMALAGLKRIIVLDELTVGLDTEFREQLWNIVYDFITGRTVIFTTQSIEEACVVAHKIGLMAGGSLQCVGEPASVKQFFGKGFKLKVVLGAGDEGDKGSTAPSAKDELQSESDKVAETKVQDIKEAVDALFESVKKHVPDAALNNDVPSKPELVFMLPSETATIKSLGAMCSDLTANRAKLKIKSIGLYGSSLEDEFLKMAGQLSEGSQPEQDEMWTGDGDGGDGVPTDNEETIKSPKVQSGSQLAYSRFTALLIKRCIHFIRRWGLWILQILLPFVLFMTIVHRTYEYAEPRGEDNSTQTTGNSSGNSTEDVFSSSKSPSCPILMTLKSYENPTTVYYATSNPDYVKTIIGTSGKYYDDVVNDLRFLGERDIKKYKREYIAALDVNRESNPPEVKAMYNLYPYHSAPLAINLANNVIMKYLDPNATRAIHLTSRPFDQGCDDDKPSTYRYRRRNQVGRHNDLYLAQKLITFLLPFALLIIVTSCIVVPIEEKLCRVKQLETMSGASPLLYWGSFFTFDYGIIYCSMSILMLIYMLIFDWYRVYTDGAGAFLLILMMYGFAGIPFSYVFSLRAGSVAGGFILLLLIHVVTGHYFGAHFLLAIPTESMLTLVIIIINSLCPTYSLTRALVKFGYISIRNSNCRLLDKCETGNTPYLTWTMNASSTDTDDEGRLYNNYEIPGILQDLLILFIMGVIYAVILLLNGYKLCSRNSVESDSTSKYSNDDDVQIEAERVNNLVASGQTNEDCLVVQNLSKSYGNTAAVKRLSFGVHHGECFGLLGGKGAGKTTALCMITGDESLTAGEVYGFSTTVRAYSSQFFSNIGYCPQFDGHIPEFKGVEMLQLFAGLRGVPFNYRKTEAMKWLKKVGLSEFANVPCKDYNGGMKRRLTIAMALIGDPALILLDEPTSGVDPASRRQLWKILDKCRDSGQTVILTSQSLEECEARCSRLAIMVNGEFQCFGVVQQLKNKFAKGFSLIIKLSPGEFPPNFAELQEKMDRLNEKIVQKFEPCTLKDQQKHLVQYHLENPSLTWDSLLKTLEEFKEEFKDFIEDFAVNETSLEEVFLDFAKAQYPERKVNGKLECLKRWITCSC